MQIFGQVWLWSLGSFLLGAFFTWLLLVRPARRRLAELETTPPMPLAAPGPGLVSGANLPVRPEPTATRVAEPVLAPPDLPGPNATDRSLDDLFDSQVKSPPPLPPLVPPTPAEPANIHNRLNPGPTAPPEPPLEPPSPTLMVPSVGAITSPPEESDTELADNSWQAFTESTTVFVPPSNLPPVPASAEPTGQDWFAKEAETEVDPHEITDVEDDEQVDNTGTIFTQHTTPIPAEMIRTLDSQPEVPAETPAEMTQAITPPPPAKHELPEEPAPPFTAPLEPEPTHAFTPPTTDSFTPHEPEPAHAFTASPSEPYAQPSESFAPQANDFGTPSAGESFAPQQEPTHAFTRPANEPYAPPSESFTQPEPEPTQAFTASPSEQYSPPNESFAPPASEFVPQSEPGPTQAFSSEPAHAFSPEPADSGRSLFEPVIPVADQHSADEQGEFVPPGPFGPGSAMPLPGGGSPAPEFNVKASVTALRYCTKDNPQFDRIVAEVWFRTPSDAERVGFRVLS